MEYLEHHLVAESLVELRSETLVELQSDFLVGFPDYILFEHLADFQLEYLENYFVAVQDCMPVVLLIAECLWELVHHTESRMDFDPVDNLLVDMLVLDNSLPDLKIIILYLRQLNCVTVYCPKHKICVLNGTYCLVKDL